MRKIKKIGLILVMALLFSVFQTGAAYHEHTFEANGTRYIVKISEPSEGQVRLMRSLGLEEIYKEAGLFLAKCRLDIESLGDAVVFYEQDRLVRLFTPPPSNDPLLQEQWCLFNTNAPYAWEAGLDGAYVRIAVIDSGINRWHEDFGGTYIAQGLNLLDGSNDVSDNIGHGTFISGVIAATRDNYLGIAGVTSSAVIIPLKCFDEDHTYASYIVSAIYKAVDVFNSDVINLSLGIDQSMRSLTDAINHAISQGVLVVSAVGNSGTAHYYYPAALPNVVGVGSINSSNRKTAFSQQNTSVFVLAPGVNLIGLGINSTYHYVIGSGTSYSAPFVTAAAAMLKQYAPHATQSDFMTLLRQSSIPLYGSPHSGYGRLNFKNFIEAMREHNFGIGHIFPDVIGHWAEESIEFCVMNNYFHGVSENSFAPDATMTRAMFVTVLSRMSEDEISGFENQFIDVSDYAWYTQAIAWGVERGLVTGIGYGRFDPYGNVTREQMAVFLHRYVEVFDLSDLQVDWSLLLRFTDYPQISGFALEAMAWVIGHELIMGRTPTILASQESSTRAEVATIVMRFSTAFTAQRYAA